MGAWVEFEDDVLQGVCVVLLLGRVLVHLIGFVDKIVSIRTGVAVVALICVGRRNCSRTSVVSYNVVVSRPFVLQEFLS